MSKLKLLLLPYGILKLLAIHGLGCSVVESLWQLESKLDRFCNLMEEYTKRFILARTIWCNVDHKLLRTVFCETYLTSQDKRHHCKREIKNLSKYLVPNLIKQSKEKTDNLLVQSFSRYFSDTNDVPKCIKTLHRKVMMLKSKTDIELHCTLYSADTANVNLYENLTPAVIDLLAYLKWTNDISFIFLKVFSNNLAISLYESDKRYVVYLQFIYCLLHHQGSKQNSDNFNRLIKTVYMSFISDTENDMESDDEEIQPKRRNRLVSKRACPIKCIPLLRSRDDFRHSTSSSLPNIKRLERLIKCPSGLNEEMTFELIDLTRYFCTFKVGYQRGRFIVDGERETFLKSISPQTCPVLYKAIATASNFEVMRPFHISPCIAFSLGEHDVQLACLILLMLSTVHNVMFVPEMDVESNFVVVTPSAKSQYIQTENDVHVTIRTTDSVIVSEEILTDMIESLIANENCVV